jgi:hypothetical protein
VGRGDVRQSDNENLEAQSYYGRLLVQPEYPRLAPRGTHPVPDRSAHPFHSTTDGALSSAKHMAKQLATTAHTLKPFNKLRIEDVSKFMTRSHQPEEGLGEPEPGATGTICWSLPCWRSARLKGVTVNDAMTSL